MTDPEGEINPRSREAEAPADLDHASFASRCRRRMLAWSNPVEYVNDMYGCHPGDGDSEYFTTVFGHAANRRG